MERVTHSELCQIISEHRKLINQKHFPSFSVMRLYQQQGLKSAKDFCFNRNLLCCTDEKFIEFINSKHGAKCN